MRIAVTGLTGFIGRKLADIAQTAGAELIAIDRIDLKDAHSAAGMSPETTARLLEKLKSCQAIIHLAGMAHRRKSAAEDYDGVNHKLTIRLAECAKKASIDRFIFVSTILVHGNFTGEFKITAETKTSPNDDYAKSKLKAEIGLIEIAEQSKKFKVIIFRTPLVVGRGAGGNLKLLRKAIQNGLPLPKIIDNQRDLISVENLGQALLRAATMPMSQSSKVLVISDKKSISTYDMIKAIAEGLRRRPLVLPVPKLLQTVLIRLPFLRRYAGPLFSNFEVDSRATWEFLGISPLTTTNQELIAVGEGRKFDL
jgi:UDP-4-keto-D-FucNAc 4-reductase